MSKPAQLVATFLAIAVAASCSSTQDDPTKVLTGQTFGTQYHVTIPATLQTDGATLESLRIEIDRELEQIDRVASTYKKNSELSVFNASESNEWQSVSQTFCHMLAATDDLRVWTNGAYNAAMAPLVNAWGFGHREASEAIPTSARISALLREVGEARVEVDCENGLARKSHAAVRLDFSGWAKGYAVDRIADLLESAAVQNFIVEIGGEIRVRGEKSTLTPFVIGIEHPRQQGRVVDTRLPLSDIGLATSGDYRNFRVFEGKRYSHTLDPRTGWPVSHDLASVTVLHQSAATADGYATALLVMGPEDGLSFANERGISALFVIVVNDIAEIVTSDEFETAIVADPLNKGPGNPL